MAMERNGDGTISSTNLHQGMNRLGMAISNQEFSTLMKTVRNVQRNVNAPPSGDDVYFSDLVHAFEREITPMVSIQSEGAAREWSTVVIVIVIFIS